MKINNLERFLAKARGEEMLLGYQAMRAMAQTGQDADVEI